MIEKSLFPDNSYGVESGGEPEHIPELTYNDFLAFHGKYYHPSNSYIYLYGDMDMVEKLHWIDQEYLSHYDYQEPTSQIERQKPFESMRETTDFYSVTEEEGTENKTYFSYNTVIEDSLNREYYLAFQILDYVLVSTAGAPVKQALIDAGIGDDILSSYDNGIMQPMFSISAKNAGSDQKEAFMTVLMDTLKKICKEGIPADSLKAAINYFEFKYREADFGPYPKGLMYGLQIFDSWLYDSEKPFIHVKANDTFEFLKKQIGTGYYEKLIEKYLIRNPHSSLVSIEPKIQLAAQNAKAEMERLASYQSTLTMEQRQKIVEETKELKRYQEESSPQEDLEKIPLLSIDDIEKKVTPLILNEQLLDQNTYLTHPVFTNGIAYVRLLFNVKGFEEYVHYVSLLVTLIGYVNTKNYSYLDLSNEIDIHTGGIVNSVFTTEKNGQDDPGFWMDFQTKTLYGEMDKALELIEEMIQNTILTDEKRLKDVVAETRSRLQNKLVSSGHTTAVSRALSYGTKSGWLNDQLKGMGFYDFLLDFETHFDEKKADTIAILQGLMKVVFQKSRLLVSITAQEEAIPACEEKIRKFAKCGLWEEEESLPAPVYKAGQNHNEGFITAGKVQYVARTGNFCKAGLNYTGALKVVRTMLSYDYLWNRVRVKGGAYGAMSGFSSTGTGYFASYRDPNLDRTNDVFKGVKTYLENFKPDPRDMTKFIIGTISDLDVPLTPKAKGGRVVHCYLNGITNEALQKERDQVLNATVESIRATATIAGSIIDQDYICVVGSEEKIRENKELFDEIKTMR